MTDPDAGDAGASGEAADPDRPRYVHRPSGEPAGATADRRFDWRGWLLVATLVLAFLVVPGALLVLPSAQGLVGALGLSVRDAYLVLPLVPAFLLGAVAVWSAVRSRSG